jgi:acyl-CoA thioesterase
VVIPKKIYPEYVQNFIDEVESKTPYKVSVAQYNEGSGYHVGVCKAIPHGRYHCIWMVSYAKIKEELDQFWSVKDSLNNVE